MNSDSPVTRGLKDLRAGKEGALEGLVDLLYDDLRRLAAGQLDRQAADRTLNPTGLVHEAYLRLAGRHGLTYEDRSHFFAACAVVMRHIVIDFARKRHALKRGGGTALPLDDDMIRIDEQAADLLAIDEAIERLGEYGDRLPRIVECRFFAGLTELETADALGISERTVRRDWIKARALLADLLSGDAA